MSFQTPTKQPHKRRTLSAAASPLSPAARPRGNNDMLEKEAKRRNFVKSIAAAAANHNGHSPFRSPRVNPAASARRPEISEQDITDVYANCIKLCTENKINQKNSWQLPLIDYMNDVMKTKHGELTNFQIASCTLDASVKIYSYRVDSVHSEAYKVLGGINRSDKQDDSGDNEEVDESGHQTEKKKKKKARTVNTIESNPEALNVKKFDLAFDVDPLFKQTSAAFDEGGARGLLLNHLATRDDGALLFDSQDQYELSMEDKPIADMDAHINAICGSSCKDDIILNLVDEITLKLDASRQLKICPSLVDFKFAGWVPSENDIQQGTDQSANPADLLKSSGESNDVGLDLNMDVGGGFAGADSDDDDFYDTPDTFDDAAHRMTEVAGGEADREEPQSYGGIHIASIKALLDDGPNDYGYFNEKHLQNWAGPAHWKPRKLAETKTTDKKSRTKKEKFQFDFFSPAPEWEDLLADSRASTVLSKATLQKCKDEFLLPEDVHYEVVQLRKLFLRPQNTIVVRNENDAVEVGNGGAWYNYDNPNDANNYCGGADSDDDDFHDAQEGMAPEPFAFGEQTLLDDTIILGQFQHQQQDGALELVSQPRQVQRVECDLYEFVHVEKIHIDYAKHAKRVNVKQLKASMWTELTGSSSELQKTAPDESARDCEFSEVVADVPQKVNQKMAQNLSVPIMFVCLLHLANEKCLKISNDNSDLTDLKIAQD